MNNPVVSIIVPVYKNERYLRNCIESVLGQTFQNFEIVLVDDGSPDNCGMICDAYAIRDERVIVHHKKNEGVSSARNDGMKLARGEYLAFLDSDDYWLPTHLEDIIAGFKTYPEAGIVATARYNVDENGHKKIFALLSSKKIFEIKHFALYSPYVLTSTLAIRKDIFNLLGGFRDKIKRGEDLDFWLRISCKYRIIYVTNPTVCYRIGTEFSSSKSDGDLLSGGFPYWEWYSYNYRYKLELDYFTSKQLKDYLLRSIKRHNLKSFMFYFRKIKWYSYICFVLKTQVHRLRSRNTYV